MAKRKRRRRNKYSPSSIRLINNYIETFSRNVDLMLQQRGSRLLEDARREWLANYLSIRFPVQPLV